MNRLIQASIIGLTMGGTSAAVLWICGGIPHPTPYDICLGMTWGAFWTTYCDLGEKPWRI